MIGTAVRKGSTICGLRIVGEVLRTAAFASIFKKK
jgi:hypothetical protein